MIKLLEKSDDNDIERIEALKDHSNEKEKVKIISELMIKYGINILTKNNIEYYFQNALMKLDEIESKDDYKIILRDYFNKMMVRIN